MDEPWVELRVHGVSGTPPEDMLGFPHVKQVAGDEFGRYFRRFDERGDELRAESDGHVVEAYHWGRFTSGSWSQAVWLLLAPFGIVNAAQFMLEPPTSRPTRAAYVVAGAMLRLVGLALTVLFVLGTAVISLDLWAWQRIDLSPIARDRVIVVAALLAPVALLIMCFTLGRSRLVGTDDSSYAPARPGEGGAARVDPARAPVDAPGPSAVSAGPTTDRGVWTWARRPPSDLVRPGFLGGDPRAPALRMLHLATGLAVVGVLGFSPGKEAGQSMASFAWSVSYVLLGLCAVAVIMLGDPERSSSVALEAGAMQRARALVHRSSRGVAITMASLGGVIVLLAVGHAVVRPADRANTATHYPGVELLANVTMVAAMTGMVALLVANVALAVGEKGSSARADNPKFAPFAGGLACTLITSLGIFVGLGYVGASGVAAAKAIATEERDVVAPELMTRIVYTWGLMVLVVAIVVVIGLIRRRASAPELRRRVRVEVTRADGVRLPPRWIKHVAAAVWSARLKNSLVPVLASVTVVGWALSAATGWELLPLLWAGDLYVLPPWLSWLSESASADNVAVGFVMWLGTLALSGLAAGLVFIGRTSIGGEATRRSVNVIWDVIAFWPRSAHPFVPPAYAQRAVKDVERRLAVHLDRTRRERVAGSTMARPGRDVVLCAHSQGSLVAFAALLRIRGGTAVTTGRDQEGREHGPADLDRIGLLTCGSQLQVLFARGFPAYVNFATVSWLYDELDGAWRNLYRDTDYLAGPVLSWSRWSRSAGWFGDREAPSCLRDEGPERYGSDWRLLDPPLPDLAQRDRPLTALRRHSDYWADVAWSDALGAVRRPGATVDG